MRYLLFTFFWVYSVMAYCQIPVKGGTGREEQVSFEHYGQDKGLSQGTINDIANYDGFMWFATQDGLNRFDGYGFKVFRTNKTQALNSNLVQALLADSQDRLWIGTSAGLNLYDRKTGTISGFADTFGVRHAVDVVSIKHLLEDRQGRIWIQTVANGLFCFDPGLKKNQGLFPQRSNHSAMSC